MRYRIVNETEHRIRIKMYSGEVSQTEEEILKYTFSSIVGVTKVTVYAATGGCALEYDGDRALLIAKLDAFNYENVRMMAQEEKPMISMQEVKDRKLDPGLKRRLRIRILIETAADVLLPVPLQIGYHVYQMVTLRDV